nr:glutathione S-transferase domain-containing protein [Raoultella sp. NCTC 9187]
MKLYYSPGSCSLSPHIALREAGLDFELIRVDTKTHTWGAGNNYYDINPLGYVPALETADGIYSGGRHAYSIYCRFSSRRRTGSRQRDPRALSP